LRQLRSVDRSASARFTGFRQYGSIQKTRGPEGIEAAATAGFGKNATNEG